MVYNIPLPPPQIHKNSSYWQTFFDRKTSTQALLNTWKFWDSDELDRVTKPLCPFPIPCPLHPFHTATPELHLYRTNQWSSKLRHTSFYFIAFHCIVLQILHFLFLSFFFFFFFFANWRFVVTLYPVSCHFSNSICSLQVFESHFGNSCAISNV